MSKIKVQMFMDYICEFCYLSYWILNELSKSYELEIEYILFEIHPDTPVNGMPMKAHMQEKTRFTENINRFLKKYNRKLIDKDIFANTNLALCIGVYALQNGIFESYTRSLWNKYMEQGLNISKESDLFDCCMNIGITPSKVYEINNNPYYKFVLLENEKNARKFGIEGVPVFIVNGEFIVRGCQSQTTWEKLFQKILQNSEEEKT